MAIFEDYISLKEAGQISGYHPDYIGALIRSGKIHGEKRGKNWYVSKKEVQEHFMTKHYVSAKRVFFSPLTIVLILAVIFVIGWVTVVAFSQTPATVSTISGASATSTEGSHAPKTTLTDYENANDPAIQFNQ